MILSAPVILYQVWAFIAPALYKHERRLVVPLLVSSSLLFYIGMAFAYFVVFSAGIWLPCQYRAGKGAGIHRHCELFKLRYGAVLWRLVSPFEVPVAIVLLCWMGITSPEDLRKKRPYVLVGAFVVGCCWTPPDVFANAVGDPDVLPV